MRRKIELSLQQRAIMSEFYNFAPTKVVYNKKERNALWKVLTKGQISSSKLAQIERKCPAGRNLYAVWTPDALAKFLEQKRATIDNGIVRISQTELTTAKPRGGSGVSRYKINSLFFVRAANCHPQGDDFEFCLSDVRQLNPTITAKMFFKNLKYAEVKKHYFENNN